jgi:phytoene dehydrogenase-like protein
VSGRALVVGAGPNGLSAAIALAEAGREVTVLEAADRPGGAVRTEELTLPGFRHDTFSSVYPAAAASPVFARMPLDRHGLRWVHPEACYSHPLPEGRAVSLYRDVERTAGSLDAEAPGDGERWARFAAPYLANYEGLRAAMLGAFPPLRGGAKLLLGLGPRGFVEFGRLTLMPAAALGHELFSSGGSRAWLYGAAMHGDTPPLGAGSAVAAGYLALLGHAVGWPSPQGGADGLSGALVSYLESLGGTIRTGARVVRIGVERGRVVGVELAGGERIAGPLVIGDILPGALARLTGDALPPRYRAAMTRYRMGQATVKVDWALDGPIPWSAPEVHGAGTVHVGGTEDEVLRATSEAVDLPASPFLLLGQQTIADPSRAPAGKHTAWAYTHGPQGIDWEAETDRHVERVEAQVERFAPGFRDLILARHVLGPAALEERNANLAGGDVGGGSYSLDQLLFRPNPSLSPYRTPIRGLYLGSAATFPGGAVHGVPGDSAARVALLEARLRRF